MGRSPTCHPRNQRSEYPLPNYAGSVSGSCTTSTDTRFLASQGAVFTRISVWVSGRERFHIQPPRMEMLFSAFMDRATLVVETGRAANYQGPGTGGSDFRGWEDIYERGPSPTSRSASHLRRRLSCCAFSSDRNKGRRE
jgi:hypothetical protein